MNLDSNKVSIALATYNGEKFLSRLLVSLEKQTTTPYEIVIVDDCSSDKTLEIINSFSFSFSKRVYTNQKNLGAIATFKKLASLCEGDYIAFCDQDDVWMPEKIQLSVKAISQLKQYAPAIVFTDMSVIDENDLITEKSYWERRKIKPGKFIFKDILFANLITGCTSLINKAMATELLKMPLNVCMHDHWMALIAYSFGNYAYINEPTLFFRSHQASVTNKEKSTTLSVFFNDFKSGKNYLQENILQAKEFAELYSDQLSKKNIRSLERFIKLKESSFVLKRIRRDLRSIARKIK